MQTLALTPVLRPTRLSGIASLTLGFFVPTVLGCTDAEPRTSLHIEGAGSAQELQVKESELVSAVPRLLGMFLPEAQAVDWNPSVVLFQDASEVPLKNGETLRLRREGNTLRVDTREPLHDLLSVRWSDDFRSLEGFSPTQTGLIFSWTSGTMDIENSRYIVGAIATTVLAKSATTTTTPPPDHDPVLVDDILISFGLALVFSAVAVFTLATLAAFGPILGCALAGPLLTSFAKSYCAGAKIVHACDLDCDDPLEWTCPDPKHPGQVRTYTHRCDSLLGKIKNKPPHP